jgi:hypothetical protein
MSGMPSPMRYGVRSRLPLLQGPSMGKTRVIATVVLLANLATAGANDGPLDISFGFLGQVD